MTPAAAEKTGFQAAIKRRMARSATAGAASKAMPERLTPAKPLAMASGRTVKAPSLAGRPANSASLQTRRWRRTPPGLAKKGGMPPGLANRTGTPFQAAVRRRIRARAASSALNK